MMFYMNSVEMLKDFIPNESCKSILNAQYVLVSSKIRIHDRKKYPNVIVCMNDLYPDIDCMSALTNEDMRIRYFEQLDKNKGLISTLIRYSLVQKENIIFLCTKNESKMRYLEWLSEYVFMEFEYPIYKYSSYANGFCSIKKYNTNKVLETVDEILSSIKFEEKVKNLSSRRGREKIKSSFADMSKKEMKNNLKNRGLWKKGMSKKEMLEMLELFL